MPVATPESQFKFLISCIRWSNSGKVDFAEVAKECLIVSKGAAAKRYERMMKIHGIAPNATPQKARAIEREVKAESREEENNPPPAKKRKVNQFNEDNQAVEDDPEEFEYIKPESSNHSDESRVKEECGQMNIDNVQGQFRYIPLGSGGNQIYNTGRSMYETNAPAYGAYVNVAGMENPARFIGLGEYGPSDTRETVKAAMEVSQCGPERQCKPESIVIIE